jgi:hypothetical protein
MEWAFRLMQEPRRLFKRYLVHNSAFTWQVSKALVTRSHRADRLAAKAASPAIPEQRQSPTSLEDRARSQ